MVLNLSFQGLTEHYGEQFDTLWKGEPKRTITAKMLESAVLKKGQKDG